MARLPDPLQSLLGSSKDEVRNAITILQKILNFKPGSGLDGGFTLGGGLQISLSPQIINRIEDEAKVILVGILEPGEDGIPVELPPDTSRLGGGKTGTKVDRKIKIPIGRLVIRRIEYANFPPVENDYQWKGVEFHAYPDFGMTIEDYREFIFTERDPTINADYFTAKNNGQYYILQRQDISATRQCVVVNIGTGMESMIQIKLVSIDEDIVDSAGDPILGKFKLDEKITTVFTWGNFRSNHFAPYLYTNPISPIAPEAKVITIIRINGNWFALPVTRWAPQLEDLNAVETSDCTFAQPRA